MLPVPDTAAATPVRLSIYGWAAAQHVLPDVRELGPSAATLRDQVVDYRARPVGPGAQRRSIRVCQLSSSEPTRRAVGGGGL